MLELLLAATSTLGVSSLPERPYAEIVDRGFAVNGDLIVENRGGSDVELRELRVDAFDRQGRLIQRKEVNGNGSAPSIETMVARIVKPGGAAMVFSPLATFPFLPARIDYVLTYEGAGGKEERLSITVAPKIAPPAVYRFPLRGRILVWDGHDALSHHRRVDLQHPILKGAGFATNSGRYSYDLVPLDRGGARSAGDEGANRSWIGFGAPVQSSGAGTVESVRTDLPDNRQFDFQQVAVPNVIFGNYVIVREKDGSRVLYGHLQQGSVAVRPGQQVTAGQFLARIGASGSANFPHLHYQRMDGPNDRSEGIPTRFKGVVRPDGSAFANGYVDSGDIVIAD